MTSILITFLLFVLILVSLFLVLVVLMQRASASGGLGAAFGGGVAESAFGADTGNVLTKATKLAAGAFFVLSLSLYLLIMGTHGKTAPADSTLPIIDSAAAESAALPVDAATASLVESVAGTTVESPVTNVEAVETAAPAADPQGGETGEVVPEP